MLVMLQSCGSLTDMLGEPKQKLSPETYYKNDLCFTFHPKDNKVYKGLFKKFRRRKTAHRDRIQFCGTAVLPYQKDYSLTVQGFGKANFFSMMTCHEENTTENPDRGIFKKKGQVKITYKPTDLERGRACPLYISMYNKRQKHGQAILLPEDKRFQLKAKLQCNGYDTEHNGVSICDSREGLVQEITFDEKVIVAKPVVGGADKKKPCQDFKKLTKDFKTFRFKLDARECFQGFVGEDSLKEHMLLNVGHEDIIIRE